MLTANGICFMWKSLDKRVAAFLPEESAIELTDKDKLEELSEI